MKYPSELIQSIGGAQALADAINKHPLAPSGDTLTRDAIYVWKNRQVPFKWRNAILDIASQLRTPSGSAEEVSCLPDQHRAEPDALQSGRQKPAQAAE